MTLRRGLAGSVTADKVRLKYAGWFGIDSGVKFVGRFAWAQECELRGYFAKPVFSLIQL